MNPTAFDDALALARAGRPAEAEAALREVVAYDEGHAGAHFQLGVLAHTAGRLAEAVGHYRRALALAPIAPAWGNLGVALESLGDLAGAATALTAAIAVTPRQAELHFNLANVRRAQGLADAAISSYRQAIALAPDLAAAHENLGIALHESGDAAGAIACYQRAHTLEPGWGTTLANLALALIDTGHHPGAIAAAIEALAREDVPATRMAFGNVARATGLAGAPPAARPLLARALREGWTRPNALVAAAMSFLAAGPLDLERDDLLHALLENAQAGDLGLERTLAAARRALLAARTAPPSLAFSLALARQCFINGYVYAEEADEAHAAAALRAALTPASPAWDLLRVAMYFPLDGVLPADTTPPSGIEAVWRQQVTEPARERALVASLPRRTGINDGVSTAVRAQYEEHPYPRWVQVPLMPAPLSLPAYFAREFPRVVLPGLPAGPLAVLIAGCGTGQHAIEAARQWRDATVTAIDLSLASLCYAARKAEEAGVANIAFAQADILALGDDGGQRYDIIESVGVLHHLADPAAGWRILRGLLAPRGLMRIGLYSEAARQAVAAARTRIAQEGLGSSLSDIRRFRAGLMQGDALLADLAGLADFHGAHECRDLLFHVQEHRFTIPAIAALLEDLSLDFVGFTLEPAVTAAYDAMFPVDAARTSLANWDAFERARPATFTGMYQFWARARA